MSLPWMSIALVFAFIALERHAKAMAYRKALHRSIDVIMAQRSALGALLYKSAEGATGPSVN